jgi:hypothetical protein
MDMAIMGAGLGLGLSYALGFIGFLLLVIYGVCMVVYTAVYFLITGRDPHTGKTMKDYEEEIARKKEAKRREKEGAST